MGQIRIFPCFAVRTGIAKNFRRLRALGWRAKPPVPQRIRARTLSGWFRTRIRAILPPKAWPTTIAFGTWRYSSRANAPSAKVTKLCESLGKSIWLRPRWSKRITRPISANPSPTCPKIGQLAQRRSARGRSAEHRLVPDNECRSRLGEFLASVCYLCTLYRLHSAECHLFWQRARPNTLEGAPRLAGKLK